MPPQNQLDSTWKQPTASPLRPPLDASLNLVDSPNKTTADKPLKASERFRESFRESKNCGKALIEVLDDLVKLEIVTWVATTSSDNDQSTNCDRPGNRLKTTINLVDGDIENEIGYDFLVDKPYFELRQLHDQQCAKALQTIADNLKLLAEMGDRVMDFLDREQKPSA